MTTPTPPLSPAAQDVWNAAILAYSIINNQSATMEGHAAQIASHVLIAAVEQQRDFAFDVGSAFVPGVEMAADFLEALAAELRQEGQP